ncbi:MAG: cell division protein ZapA [Parafilimonas terrae]|nr:cell division protein ZapA [Parafilimonas terrae]
MPIITVTIDNRTYRMACGQGEEAHLTALTDDLSTRIGKMRESFGEIGDMRLHVMAALTISDELVDLRKRLAAMEEEVASARSIVEGAERAKNEVAARTAEGINQAATRISRLADAFTTRSGAAALKGASAETDRT